MQMLAAQAFVQETLENASADERPAVAQRVGKLAEDAPEIAALAVKWAFTEQSLLDLVRRAIAVAIPSATVQPGGGGERRCVSAEWNRTR